MNKRADSGFGGIILIIGIAFGIVLFIGFFIHLFVKVPEDDTGYSIQLPKKIADLQIINPGSIDTYEKYKGFADNVNDLIRILNEQNKWFDVPKIKDDYTSYQKISKVLTEYGPLIGNYNEVVTPAKNFEINKSDENLQNFYIVCTRFSFETVTIIGTVFYATSYKTVGIVYRASGLNMLALKCPSCVNVALSESHWAIRTTLVEASSLTSKKIMELKSEELDKINMEDIKKEVEKALNSDTSKDTQKKGSEFLENTLNITKDSINITKSWCTNQSWCNSILDKI